MAQLRSQAQLRSLAHMAEHNLIGAHTREWLVSQAACPELTTLRIDLCGISAAKSGFSFVRHAWEHSQILVCHEGEGEVWAEGGWQPCRVGHTYLCPAGAAHAYRAVGGHTWGIAWATLTETPDQTPWIEPGPPRLGNADHRGFTDAIRNLHRETLGLASLAIRGHWAALVALLATRISSEGPLEQRLDRLWEEVDQDLARDWTLGDLARLARVGPEQLRRLCRRQHQRSPVQHVTWLRMQRAATLLASQRATVADVAQAIGYDNAFAFSTAFKRVLGQPPSTWRGGC